jgi:hypothetical protein
MLLFIKPIKLIKMKAHLDFSITYPLGTKNLTNKKNKNSKGLLKTRSNSNPSKVHNYNLVKVHKTNFTIYFMISFLNPCLVTIKKFKWNSI